MKVLISERQLKRLIREFQDIYDDGIDRLTQEIEQDVKAGGFKMSIDGVIDHSWPIKREKESKRLLTLIKEKVAKFLIDYFKLGKSNLNDKINKYVNKSFDLDSHNDIVFYYAHYLLHASEEYYIVRAETGYYDFYKDDFKKSMNHLIEWIRGLLGNKKKKELAVAVSDAKTKFAPSYSGEKIEDDLSKQIYDWEYTKNILGNLFNEYSHNEKYVNEELFNKIKDTRVFDKMMDIMDKDMKHKEYKIFEPIRNNNWREDFKGFVKSYITYYGEKLNNEQQFRETIKVDKKLPPEVFFGRLLWDMTYWIFNHK